MLRFSQTLAVALFLVTISGTSACGDGNGSGAAVESRRDQAVEEAIRAHLAKRTDLNLGSMEIIVGAITYPGENEARAEVAFRASGQLESMLEMVYRLERVSGEWQVRPGAAQGATAVPAPGGSLPPDHPPVEESPQSGGGDLPPGHPPIDK